MIGTTVGSYRIVEPLGEGGMGAVYRAVDEMLDREVAVKVLRPELARQAALVDRFRQEAIALARLNHPRIATLHGMHRAGDDLLMVMEYVRGDTLETILYRSGRLAWTRAAELCGAVLDALDHAHDKGVVHRDIKPANVMLTHAGAVKVMDFGIARLVGRSRQTQVGHSVGTPVYMAPEQLRGEEVDGRTDLYAVGAVLFELTTGRVAFEADSDYGLMMKQVNEPPPPASSLVGDVPSVVDEIVARAMAKRREDRFPDAVAFRAALDRAVDAARLHSARVATPRPPAAFPATRIAATPAEPRPASPFTPPPAAMPATRLAPVGATAEQPLPSSDPARRSGMGSGSTAGWARDWRTYAGAAALLVVATLGARLTRPLSADVEDVPDSVSSPVVPGAAGTLERPVPDSGGAGVGASVGGGIAASGSAQGEDASTLILPPPPPSPVSRPVDVADERPVRDERPAPARRRVPPPERVTVGPPAPPSIPERPARTERSDPDDGGTAAREHIAGALSAFARAVGDKQVGAIDGVLRADGETASRWLTLMREGRLSMRLDGAPAVEPRGSRAGATFAATLAVRSPFGGTKRQAAEFVAELARSGDRWNVVSVRPVGRLELK